MLALCAFPIEAAATRFRLAQFVEPLGEQSTERRLAATRHADQK